MKKINYDTVVGQICTGFDNEWKDLQAEHLQKWAYNQLAAAPKLLETCKDFVVFDWEHSNLHWPTIAMWISRFQQTISKAEQE